MTCANLPIQVIAHWGTDGTLQPLRFRYEDRQSQIHTIQVEQIMDVRTIDVPGMEALMFLCKGRNHLYELKYTLMTHCWQLFRQIY